MASVLIARGVLSREQAARWLSQADGATPDPFLLPDMEAAVERLHAAVRRGEPICFYGDYDVDGMSATALYVAFFRSVGADARWYVPHRVQEGYGLNAEAVRRLAADGVSLLVTSDCGTTAVDEVALAHQLGLDVIITDHHQCGAVLPPAVAVINPMRSDSAYPFTGLCSAGLVYKVVSAYAARFGAAAVTPDSLLDLVALATVADMVPLQDENRRYVMAGLALIARGARCGIRALKEAAGVNGPCNAGTLGYRLAPRLNAAGRLAHAASAVRLLLTESEQEAQELAAELEGLNRERQRIEEEITAEAAALVGEGEAPAALVLASRNWHVGVVGIVAARLVERYHRPAVVIAVNADGIGKGSARTVAGFDLYRGLSECADTLVAFGGHPSAAGVTVREDRIATFAERFAAVAAGWAGPGARVPILHVDSEVSLVEMVPRVVEELSRLHPFGTGNPEPTLAVRQLTILDARVVGDSHLKLTVRQRGSVPFDSIGFRFGPLDRYGLSRGQLVDLAFMPELNRWNGLDRIQLRLRDVRASLSA